MTKILSTAIAILAVGAFSPSAHATKWTCTGPQYVCGDTGRSVSSTKRAYNKAYKKSKYAARKSKYSARKSRPARSYSTGGSSGMASYYWQGKRTASGASFNPNGLTAAHRTLPFGTRVRVTNLRNGRTVTVTINDRGPFIRGRVIDLSRGAASVIGMTSAGVARVSYSVVGRS